MRDFKKFTAKELLNKIETTQESRREWLLKYFAKDCQHFKRNQHYKVWQNGYHAEELFSNKFVFQKVEYIRNNPVQDGIVDFAENYLYCSAPAYAGMDGFLEIVCIQKKLKTVF